MNRTIGRITILLILITSVCYGQSERPSDEKAKVAFGIKAGLNLSGFSALINSEGKLKPGPTFGFYRRRQVGAVVFLRTEFIYSNQGQKLNYIYPLGGPAVGRTTFNLHYFNVPLVFEIGKKVYVQFGPQIGLFLFGKEKGTLESVTVDRNLKDSMARLDLGLVGGLGWDIGKHVNLGARMNLGLTNIYDPDPPAPTGAAYPEIQNRVLHFYLGYTF